MLIRGWRAPALIAAIVVGAAATLIYARHTPPEQSSRKQAAQFMNELMSGTVAVGGPFTLTDQYGNARSLTDFRGKLVLLYFGFLYCPDVCPTDLLAIGEVMQRLGADAQRVQPVFVTLDPERDTPSMLGSYVASFHPSFVALTGTEAQIRVVATAYKVFFEKVKPAGAPTYFIDHMSVTFLIDGEGQYVAALPRGTPPERIEPVVRDALSRSMLAQNDLTRYGGTR